MSFINPITQRTMAKYTPAWTLCKDLQLHKKELDIEDFYVDGYLVYVPQNHYRNPKKFIARLNYIYEKYGNVRVHED